MGGNIRPMVEPGQMMAFRIEAAYIPLHTISWIDVDAGVVAIIGGKRFVLTAAEFERFTAWYERVVAVSA